MEISVKKEEKPLCRKQKWKECLHIMFNSELDRIRFVSMITLNPGIVVLFVYYVSTIELNIPLTYLITDAWIILWWWRKALKRKKQMEEEKDIDRTEIIRRKIEELKATEERVKNQK